MEQQNKSNYQLIIRCIYYATTGKAVFEDYTKYYYK